MINYTYQVGGSLHNYAPSYVERQADREIYQYLKQGDFCYILNSRQMGKSSLLVRTKHHLEAEGYKCSTVDMTNIGSENITASQWYKGIVADLWRGFQLLGKINLKTWWMGENELSVLQNLSRFLEEILNQFPEDKIVIFIDEIDSVLSLSFPVDDFFALIRYCYNQRAIDPKYNRLTFAIFGVATPSDLIQNPKRTPFNLGKAIELQGFKLEEVNCLIKGLQQVISQRKVAIKLMEKILIWTNGQPFLTQKLCNLIISLDLDSQQITLTPRNEEIWLEFIVNEYIIKNWEYQDEPEHLKTIRDRLLYNQKTASRLLGIYQQILQGKEVITDDSREHIELLLSGLVIKKEGTLQVKNPIYQQVFNLAWVERQLENLRPYSQNFDAWIASQQTDESRLLRGQALIDAQSWAWDKTLTNLDHQFLTKSAELERKEQAVNLTVEKTKNAGLQLCQQQKNAHLQTFFIKIITIAFLTAISLLSIIFWQYRRSVKNEQLAKMNEIAALASSSTALFSSHQQLESLQNAIYAKQELEQLKVQANIHNPDLENIINNALRQAIYAGREWNRLSGHNLSIIRDLAWSPDDQKIVLASKDQVWLWSRDGKLINKFTGHISFVWTVAFSPDGQIIASGSSDKTVRFWSLTGQELDKIDTPSEVQTIAFSPNGQLLAIGMNDGSLGIWEINQKKLKKKLNIIPAYQLNISKVIFTPDSQKIITGGFDGQAILWSKEGKKLVTFNHGDDPILGLAVSPDGKLLATGGNNKKIEIWHINGRQKTRILSQHSILALAFHPNNKTLAAASWDKVVQMWTIDGQELETLSGHQEGIWAIAWNKNGTILATASLDNTVKLWQLESAFLKVLRGHGLNISKVIISPNDQFIATSSGDYTIKIWGDNGKLITTLKGHKNGINGIAFSADSKFIISGSWDKTIKIWQVNGTLLETLPAYTNVQDIALSPDNEILAYVGLNQTLMLWERNRQKPFSFQLKHTIKTYTGPSNTITFSPDGQILATDSNDKTVKLWSREGKLLHSLKGHQGQITHVTFSRDGKLIAATTDDGTVTLWHKNGKLLKTINTMIKFNSAEFTPDGKMIAIGANDKTVKFFDLDGKPIINLYGHVDPVDALAFNRNGKMLVSASGDRTAIIWNLPQIFTTNELEYACNWIKNYLENNQELQDNSSSTQKSQRNLCHNYSSHQSQ